ncbi:hypothetical protein BN13_50034 [Nostocoides jenkinsii Ben 74]|uniref:Uncharacterized protein n=1 Tax=Nostocoides jenkinsii Ben 74 TaxID=1193518 RepID=A0A077MDB2_9MICO|nr:hypothetical protein BN13_50034 [Tetrasphaera jenkinsii Ben 74]
MATADARGCPTPLTFWTGTERDPFAADLDSAFVKSLGKTCPAATGDKVWATDPASAAITLTVPDAPVTSPCPLRRLCSRCPRRWPPNPVGPSR